MKKCSTCLRVLLKGVVFLAVDCSEIWQSLKYLVGGFKLKSEYPLYSNPDVSFHG